MSTAAEMGIRMTEDRPYGQGAADLAATRDRQQAAQQTGKPDVQPPAQTSRGVGTGAVNPGRMADPSTQDVPQGDVPEWPVDIAVDKNADTPPSSADLGIGASRARQYLTSRPTRQFGGELGMDRATKERTAPGNREFHVFGGAKDDPFTARKDTPQDEAFKQKFWGDVGNAPVIKQVTETLDKSKQITQAGLGFLGAIPLGPARNRYYANVAAKSKELGLPYDDPNVMWQAAQDQWLQEVEPVPGMKGLIEAFADPANIVFVGAGDAAAAARGAAGVVKGAAAGAIAPKITAAALHDSPEVLRLESIAARLKAIPGAEKDAAEIETQLKTVRGLDAKPADPNGAAEMARLRAKGLVSGPLSDAEKAAGVVGDPEVEAAAVPRGGTAAASEVVPGEAPKITPKGSTTPVSRSKILQGPDKQRTPFESPTNPAAGITRSEAKPPIVYPTEENLGIPKGLVDSLPENLRQMVVDEARANYDDIQQARGGVVGRAAVDAEAEHILIDAGVLAQAKARTPVTAPGMIALQRAIFRVTAEREAIEAEAAALGPGGISDQLRARFAVKMFEQNSLQRVVAGARAEWGRVGQAMQAAIKSGDEVKLRNTYADIIRAVGKDNIDKVMERLQAIRSDPNLLGDPYRRQVAELKFVHGLSNASNWQKLDEVFFNAILSNPHTHMGIMVGQLVLAESEALASIGGAAINTLAHAATLGRIPLEQTFTKAIAEAVGTHFGMASGLQAAKVFLRTGIKRDELAQFVETGGFRRSHAVQNVKVGGHTVMPIGSIINTPTTLIDSYTVAFHEMGRQQSLWGQAFAKAQSEKLGSVFSKQFRARVSELMSDPSAELDVQAARDQGRRVSLRGQPANKAAQIGRDIRDMEIPGTTPLVGKVLGGFSPGRRIIPFVNISFNLATIGTEYSPLGFVRVLNPANQLGAGARSVAAARAGLGSLLWMHLTTKAGLGELTGPAPTDPNERAQFQRDGKQPYSYKVGNDWVPFDRILGPMATPARWVTGITAALKEAEGKPLDAALVAVTGAKALWAMGEAFGDSTFMLGPDQIFQAAKTINAGKASSDPKAMLGGATNYAGQQAVSQMPFSGFLRAWAQSADSAVRSVKGFIQQIEAVIPGLSTNLPQTMDVYGKGVTRQGAEQGFSGMFNPIRATRDQTDPVDAELSTHVLPSMLDPVTHEPLPQKQLFASMAAQEISNFKLTPEEGALIQVTAGRATHQAILDLVGTAAYKKMDNAAQTKAIQKAIAGARHTAREAVADAIMQKATTPGDAVRAVDIRISLLTARYERAQFLEGLNKQGKLTAAVKTGVDQMLATKYKGQPTVSEYLKAAPLIRQFLAAPPFDRGNAQEWEALKVAKTTHAALAARDKLDGTKKADAFLQSADGRIIAQYNGVPEGRDRASIRARNASVVPYLGGTTYVQVR